MRAKKKGPEKIFVTIAEFSQINLRHETTDPGNSEKVKQGKCQKKIILGISLSN